MQGSICSRLLVVVGSFVLSGALCGSGGADENLGHILREGRLFEAARDEVLRNGWVGIASGRKFIDGTLANRFGLTGDFYAAGFTEVETCTEGGVYCNFNYRRNGACLEIVTQGPYVPNESPLVSGWRDDCASPELVGDEDEIE
jgi:hypothetical protein